MTTSRELMYRALRRQRPGRIPRDIWVQPWAEKHYPNEVRSICRDFPADIGSPPRVNRPSARAGGSAFDVGEATDEWGCRFVNLQAGVHGEVRDPILSDLAQWRSIRPPYEILPSDLSAARDATNRACEASDLFLIGGGCPRPWERYQFLRGSQNAYLDLMEGEESLRALLKVIHDFYMKEMEFWASTRVDALYFMDDWGSQRQLLIPPPLWRRLFKPLYRDYCDLAHANGKFVFMHSDGYIAEVYEDLVEIGVDALNSQLFCMDLADLARKAKGQITFWGEIDRQGVLTGSPEGGRAAVRRVAEHLYDAAGGVIAQLEFGAGANPATVRAVFEEWDRIGGAGARAGNGPLPPAAVTSAGPAAAPAASGAVADLLRRYAPRVRRMVRAGMESVCWRQDGFSTGGIVESDVRVDEGRKLYFPWCWPRTNIVEPLLTAELDDRVRRFLGFWFGCQRADGSWQHCNDVRDGKPFEGGWEETDNVGYMLWHVGAYVRATGDDAWLKAHWSRIRLAAVFLEAKCHPEFNLIWGQEEAVLPGIGLVPTRYSLHINCVCARGLEEASWLAERADQPGDARRWRKLASAILDIGVGQRLWDDDRQTFRLGLTEAGQPVEGAVLTFMLMPFWMHSRFGDREAAVLAFLNRELFDKDPKIRGAYWIWNYDPVLKAGGKVESQYSGEGAWIGSQPLVIESLVRTGQMSRAGGQVQVLLDWTNPAHELVPEHINTLHAGRIGHYGVYPEPYYYVDSGNLMHLSFFLTLVARHGPELLRRDTGAQSWMTPT